MSMNQYISNPYLQTKVSYSRNFTYLV